MASVTAIREAIAAALDTIDDLNTYARSGADVAVPAAIVVPFDGVFITFDVANARGGDDLFFTVQLLVSKADDESGLDALDAYLAGSGDQSVKAAMETDPTLGGVVSDAQLAQAVNYGVLQYGGVDYLGCELAVQVMV